MTAAGDDTPGVRGGPSAAAGSSSAKSGGRGCSKCRCKTKERPPSLNLHGHGMDGFPKVLPREEEWLSEGEETPSREEEGT